MDANVWYMYVCMCVACLYSCSHSGSGSNSSAPAPVPSGTSSQNGSKQKHIAANSNALQHTAAHCSEDHLGCISLLTDDDNIELITKSKSKQT